MATKTPAPRRTPQKLSIADQLAHDYGMSVLKSTASFELLNQEDGIYTARLIHLGREYSRKFLAEAARSA